MKGMDAVVYFGDMVKFCKTLDRVGKLPQKVVNKAAGKGRTVVRRAVRGEAPVDTGALKRGIVSTGERTRTKGKKVYKLRFDPAKDNVFQKNIINPGAAGGKNKKGYYPASVEYGYLTRANEGGGLRYVAARATGLGLKKKEGTHFMRKGAEKSEATAKSAMIRTATAELEKEWMK